MILMAENITKAGAVSKFIAQKLNMISYRDSKIKSEKMNLFK